MQYELYLRASEPPALLATQILGDLGKDQEVSKLPHGNFEFLGEDGVVTVVLHPAGDTRWEGDQDGAKEPLGVDLRIPGGAGKRLASQLVDLAFDWAARWSLEVYDPQLGRTVEKAEHQTITTRVKRQSEYLTETVGLGDQSTRYMDVDGPARGLGLRSRFYLGLAVVLLVLGLLTHYCG